MKTEDIKMFHRIVESGGLMRAAELLDLPKSNLSRRLKSLEQELGINLFHRQHKSIVVSDNGRHFYKTSKVFIEQFEAEVQEMSTHRFELSGHIRVQILALPNSKNLTHMITEFMLLHPKVTIEIITSSTEFELIENNVDIGFRIGFELESTDLIARKLTTVELGLYASPNYLQQHGIPRVPKDLEKHEFILFRRFDGKLDNRISFKQERINVSGRLTLNNVDLIAQSCIDHQGISILAEQSITAELEQGELVKILPDHPIQPSHGWLLYPKRKTLSPQAKALINHLVDKVVEYNEQGHLLVSVHQAL